MRLEEALGTATGQLQTKGVATPRLDAEILLAHVLGVEREDLLTRWDQSLDQDQISLFKGLIGQRSDREPVARITGVQEFWSLSFKVTPDTLIPRPDSETLVSAVLDNVSKTTELRLLDLGTGTGCLVLSLLSELPHATGVGVDISQGALACANENAKSLSLADRAQFEHFDWTGDAALKLGNFDIVISNPPYIPANEIASLEPEVATFAPKGALDGGRDGLDHYRKILETAPKFLNGDSGLIALEVGDGQAGDVVDLLNSHGFKNSETFSDLGGKTRVVMARLMNDHLK